MANNQLKKLIFIDFDDVLLNTRAFKKYYFAVFKKFGITPGRALECYAELFRKNGRYDFYPYFSLIKKYNANLSARALSQELEKRQGSTKSYVFRDSEKFLGVLQDDDWRIELVSSGNYAMQRRKLRGSGLEHFFHKIHIVPKTLDKGKEMKKVLGGRKRGFVFMDDVKVIVEDVKQLHPEAFVIQMIRYPDQEISKRADAVVKNFSEAKKLLKNFYAA